MVTQLYYNAFIPAFSNIGVPIAQAKLYFYYTETATLAPIYADAAKTIPLVNPVQANLAGKYVDIYLDSTITYRVVQTDPQNNPIGDEVDPYVPGQVYKGDPGGNAMAIGLFVNANALTIPAGFDLVQTSGYDAVGSGNARYSYDPAVDAAYVSANPRTSFRTVNGRGYKLAEPVINVRHLGAKGDGVSDDTAALNAAEAAAYVGDTSIYLPPGMFTYNGSWSIRVSIDGVGPNSQLLQIATTETARNIDGLIRIEGQSGLSFKDFSISGAYKSPGLVVNGGSDINVEGVTTDETIRFGIAAHYGVRFRVERCVATRIRYQSGGLGPADGFYLGASIDSGLSYCHAEDFRRIGFVFEGEGVNNGQGNYALFCTACNANNSDDSGTEFNTALWAENNDGIVVHGFRCWDIAGNVGQTERSPRGIVLTAIGDARSHLSVLRDAEIIDPALPIGISVSGSGAYAAVLIDNVLIDGASTGVSYLGGCDSVTIRDLTLARLRYVNGSTGGIVVDAQSAAGSLTIDGISEYGATYTSSDAGTINVYSAAGGATGKLTVTNAKTEITMSARSPAFTSAVVANSTIRYRTPNYDMVLAADTVIDNCNIISNTATVNAGRQGVAITASCPSNSAASFTNCKLTDFVALTVGGVGQKLLMSGCRLVNTRLVLDSSGTGGSALITGCEFDNSSVARSAIYTNYYAATAVDRLIVEGSLFRMNGATVPILKHPNGQPDVVAIRNNYWIGSAASITDMTGTAISNNLAL